MSGPFCGGCGNPKVGHRCPYTGAILPEGTIAPPKAARHCDRCGSPRGDFDPETGDRLIAVPFDAIPDDIAREPNIGLAAVLDLPIEESA